MEKNSNWTRRDFLKTAGLVGGAALVSNLIKVEKTHAANGLDSIQADPLLDGVSDIHVHAAPDVRDRLINELAFANSAKNAGYRSIMYKSNEWSCQDRAYLIREALPGIEVFGSLCMNMVHGDKVNVHAAQMAVQTTGNYCRCIWMPTGAAAYQYKIEKRPGCGIPVLSDAGKVLPEVVKVMEICGEADIIFATGHCSPVESVVLAKKAKEVGLNKFVVTHANSHIWQMTHDQIKTVIDLGGWIEYSYITNLWGPGTGVPMNVRLSDEEFIAYVKINPAKSFITTDLGQVNMPHPIDGMRMCIELLQKAGITQTDIDLLVRSNPAKLVNLTI